MKRISLNEEQNNPVEVARRIPHPRDPPGQRSIYITPGDHREQVYRLLTFKEFPNNNVDPYLLAKNGFCYTGYKDRAKCHSCGVAVEDWKIGSDTNFYRWHQEDCTYITNCNIVTRHNDSSNNNGTSSSSAGNRTTSSPHLAAAGEVLMSNTSRGHSPVNSAVTSTWTVPTTHQSNSRSVAIVNTSAGTTEASPTYQSIPQRNASTFPCHHPINPHMRDRENRLQTFVDRATNWPAHRINATPREIVDAGFFYLGERDRVKCWYCNGGLQNWEKNDNAWEEHAKWFPMCEYVLQQKGVEFVHQIVFRNPNLRRPSLYNPANIQFSNTLPRTNSVVGFSHAPSPASANGPEIIDPQERIHKMQRKMEQDMSSSELVQQAILMGFTKELIKAALKRQYETNDCGFSNFETMVDALIHHENDDVRQDEEQEVHNNAEQESKTNPEEPASSGQTELKQLVELRKCKVCHKEDACMVFVPCGHLACCVECGNKVNRCPACRSFIKERIRSYLS